MPETTPTDPQEEKLAHLAQWIVETCPDECDCGEFLDHVAAYLEHHQAGTPLPPQLVTIEGHLKVCPECDEEFQALVLATDQDL